MSKATVLHTEFAWYTGSGADRVRNSAARGDVVDLPDKALAAGLEAGALAKGEQTVDPATGLLAGQEPPDMKVDVNELSDKALLELAQRRGADVSKDTPRDELIASAVAAAGGHERPSV